MITAFLSQPGLWFLVRQCRGLRSEADKTSLPGTLACFPPSPGSLTGGGEACGALWGRGSPAGEGHHETRAPMLDTGFL